MTRRAGALAGIAILVALVLMLVWNVYRQHKLMHVPDESGIVRVDGATARAVIIPASAFC